MNPKTSDNLPAKFETPIGLKPSEMSVEEVFAQVQKIQMVMERVMKKGEHYGVIPGTDKEKPSLLKPGAEKLCLTFRLDPEYTITTKEEGDHLTVVSTCTLFHIPTGDRVGSGMGSCSSKESKYAYRKAKLICPKCAGAFIIKGKAEFGGGWICYQKLGGCNAKYSDYSIEITSQKLGRIQNPDLADQWNTILKMANKRSLIAAVLNATAASDIFTQDLEEDEDPAVGPRIKATRSLRQPVAKDLPEDWGNDPPTREQLREPTPVAPELNKTKTYVNPHLATGEYFTSKRRSPHEQEPPEVIAGQHAQEGPSQPQEALSDEQTEAKFDQDMDAAEKAQEEAKEAKETDEQAKDPNFFRRKLAFEVLGFTNNDPIKAGDVIYDLSAPVDNARGIPRVRSCKDMSEAQAKATLGRFRKFKSGKEAMGSGNR